LEMPRLSPQDPLFLAVIFHELRYLASTTPNTMLSRSASDSLAEYRSYISAIHPP
jgi:hypothetical protein